MSNKLNYSMSLAKPDAQNLSMIQKIAVFLGIAGLFIMILALLNVDFPNKAIFLTLSLGLIIIGTVIFSRDAYPVSYTHLTLPTNREV